MSQSDYAHSQEAWDQSYAPRADGRLRRPPWYELDCADLAECVRSSQLPCTKIRRIIDVGAGYGIRTILAVAMNDALNRPDVEVVCVDLSKHAVEQGQAVVRAVHAGRPLSEWLPYQVPTLRASFRFQQASAASLPDEITSPPVDILVDWMMLHGLPSESRPHYLNAVDRMGASYIFLKCFTREHGSLRSLPESVPGVSKHQFSDTEVLSMFGGRYAVLGQPRDWPEDLSPKHHTDGPIAAKRAYCLERR